MQCCEAAQERPCISLFPSSLEKPKMQVQVIPQVPPECLLRTRARVCGHGRGQNLTRSPPSWKFHSDGGEGQPRNGMERGPCLVALGGVRKHYQGVGRGPTRGLSLRPPGGGDLREWEGLVPERMLWLADHVASQLEPSSLLPETRPLRPSHPCPLCSLQV